MNSFKKNKKDNLTNYIIGIILILSVGVVPAVCRLNQVPVSDIENQMLRSLTVVNDIFSYSKSVCICILAAALIVIFLLDIITQTSEFKINFKKPQFILIGVYSIFVIISAVFSAYKPVAFTGISERYEGLWVILSYVVLFLFTQIFINREKWLYFILAGFFLSALIVGGIGMFQFFGHDFFKSDFVVKIITGKYYERINSLNFKFTEAYSTLYNPNCLGLYSAMLTPFFLSMTFFMPLKNYLKYISAGFSVIMIINLIGSSSAGGFVGFAAAMVVMAAVFVIDMFLNKKYKTKPVLYWSVFIAGILAAVVGVILIFSNSSLNNKLNSLVDSELNSSGETGYFYKDLKLEGNKAFITTQNGILTLSYNDEENDVELFDINGKKVAPDSTQDIAEKENGKIYNFKAVEGINSSCQIQYTKDVIVFSHDAIMFLFRAEDDGSLIALSKKLQPLYSEDDIKAIGFKNLQYFASGRGYIWSRSIPVALKHFFIGSGPDTFSFEFPQNDVFGKVRTLGSPDVIVDKPHNIYLQNAVNNGCISLVALLAVFLYYIYTSFKSILKKNQFTAVKIAALTGVCGYLAATLATDSVVSVAPVFWVLFGMGFAVDEL